MRDLLYDKSKLFPVLVVAVIIAVGSFGVIVLTGDQTSSSSASSESAASEAGGQGKGGVTMVSIKDFKFDPETLEIDQGTTIEWANDDGVNHTATADDGSSFNTGNLDAGTTSDPVTLDQAGTFTYVCAVHPYMHGTIEVK